MATATLRQILQRPAFTLNEDHLATNTWPNRHEYVISVARNLIYANMRNISLAIFGPGGVAANYAKKLQKGDESKFKEHFFERKRQQVTSFKESKQRNKPNARLVCWEPQEWFDALSCVGVKRIDVYDKHQQVIDAVTRLEIPNTYAHLLDIDSPLEQDLPRSDVGVALRLLEYCAHPQLAYDNITSALNDSSWLIVSAPYGRKPNLPQAELRWAKGDRRIYYIGKSFHAPHIDEERIEKLMCS